MNLLQISNFDELKKFVGKEAVVSPWVLVSQEMINNFAQVSGDHQWIHLDEERAQKDSPYGITIAHGFLTLSLLTRLSNEVIIFKTKKMGVNYGFDYVRFTGPVMANSQIRGKFFLKKLKEINEGVQIFWQVTVETIKVEKPVLIANWITRQYF